MQFKSAYVFLFIALLLLGGCSAETDSENVTTAGIQAYFRAAASGDGNTTVSAQLLVGSGGLFATNLNLSGGDVLSASTGGNTTVMSRSKNWITGDITYSATFAVDAKDTEFTISFDRANGVDAPNSSVQLPYGPDLTAPANGTDYTQAGTITVNWDNNNSSLAVNIDFDFSCNLTGRQSNFTVRKSAIANTGSIGYTVSSLLGNLVLQSGESCTCSITTSRERAGTIDPNYGEGGSFTAYQYRGNGSVVVNINP